MEWKAEAGVCGQPELQSSPCIKQENKHKKFYLNID